MDEQGIAASSDGVSFADRLEALLHLLCEELWDGSDQVRALACQSRIPEAGLTFPLQYLLCVLNLPEGRRALAAALPAWQEALDGLAALLAHVDEVRAEDRRGWAPYVCLLTAPFPVRRPSWPDLRDWDTLLVLERDGRFAGSWDGLMEWLHQQGSRENQGDIRRIRQLAAFERAYRVDLLDVLNGRAGGEGRERGSV